MRAVVTASCVALTAPCVAIAQTPPGQGFVDRTWLSTDAGGPANCGCGFRLRGGETRDERYRLATVPFVCPDARPDPSVAAMTVSGRVTFLERLALPRGAVVRVELRETSRLDAPARTLATQTFPATQGPPFVFVLSLPVSAVDPRANLSVFAEIRDGRRLMFTTDARHPVPHEGASGLDVRLRFVPGGARQP